jgi:hypothetical protein
MALAHRFTASHLAAAAGVTCFCDCHWLYLENQQTLHCLRLGRFYPGLDHIRFVTNEAVPSTSVFSCLYHWISAARPSGSACCCCWSDLFMWLSLAVFRELAIFIHSPAPAVIPLSLSLD